MEGLANVFGIASRITTTLQPGRFHIRGALNDLPYLDRISAGSDRQIELERSGSRSPSSPPPVKSSASSRTDHLRLSSTRSGKGARVRRRSPAIAYVKEAKFVPDALREKWPAEIRRQINRTAEQDDVERLVELSHAWSRAGVYDAPTGTALVLGNFTYEPIPALKIRLRVPQPVRQVRSLKRGPLPFAMDDMSAGETTAQVVACELSLGINDIVLFESGCPNRKICRA